MSCYGRSVLSALLVAAWLYWPVAYAQSNTAAAAAPLGSPVADEAVYNHFLLDEAEDRFAGGSLVPFRWDVEAWTGTDSNRLWVKSHGITGDGRVSDSDQELLYDRPITSFFDLQAGMRYDLQSGPGRAWAAFGVEGLAPYLFQTSATLYMSDAGHLAAKLVGSYDELLTQRLILEPMLEVNAYSRPDPAQDVGAGVSDLEAAVRLRYEIYRKFAPYLGVAYQRADGPRIASDLLDRSVNGWRLAIGLRMWF